MKKILIIAITALITFPAFAQDYSDDRVYTSEDGRFAFDLLSHIGYGYNIISSDSFNPSWSGEFFLNLAKGGFYPVENLGFELGIDIKFSDFSSKQAAFMLNSDRLVQAIDFSRLESLGIAPTSALERFRSSFDVFSISFPVLAKGIFGDFQLGLGVDASLNVSGNTDYNYRVRNRRYQVSEDDAKLNVFTYGLMAAVSYSDFGIYVKYYPESSKLLPAGSMDLNYLTIGIVLGL